MAVLLNWSWAVTVKTKGLPAGCCAGPDGEVGDAGGVHVIVALPVGSRGNGVGGGMLVARPSSSGAKNAHAVGSVRVGRQHGLGVAGGEVDGAALAGGGVVEWSCAVTVKTKRVPAVGLAGALTAKCWRPRRCTVMALLVPVRLLLTVSATVRVWLPAVFSVALKVPTPLCQRLLGRQTGLAIAAGEVDGAVVAGGGVVEGSGL